MKLRVLGASGAEFPGFNPPAFLIDDCLLLDAGTIGAVLDAEEQWKIRCILITHAHLDHIRGIPFLADNIIVKNKKHHITVLGIAPVIRMLKQSLLNDKVWPDFTAIPTKENPVLRLNPIKKGRPFCINHYKITAYGVNHTVPSAGYIIEYENGKKLLYTGDTGPTDGIWKDSLKPIECAIIEISFPNRLRSMALMTGHLTPNLLMKEIGKMKTHPKKILVTHPKPQYLSDINREIKALPFKGIKILSTGDTFRI